MGCERLRPSELLKLQNKTIHGFLQSYEVMVCDMLVGYDAAPTVNQLPRHVTRRPDNNDWSIRKRKT